MRRKAAQSRSPSIGRTHSIWIRAARRTVRDARTPRRPMMNSRNVYRGIACLLAALTIAACIGVAPSALGQSAEAVRQAPQLAGTALLAALRRGGYVLYFRHTSTDFGQNDD